MTTALRLIFDDCLSKHAVAALNVLGSFSRGQVDFAHLVDFSLGGTLDDE